MTKNAISNKLKFLLVALGAIAIVMIWRFTHKSTPLPVQQVASPQMPTAPVAEEPKEAPKPAPAVMEWTLKSDINFQLETIELKNLGHL